MSNDIFEAFILFYRKWLKIIGTKCCVSWWNPKRSKNFIHKGFWSYRCIQPTSVWKDSKIEESLQKWVWFTTQINHLVGRFWNWLEPLNFQTQSTLIFRRNSCLFLGWGDLFVKVLWSVTHSPVFWHRQTEKNSFEYDILRKIPQNQCQSAEITQGSLELQTLIGEKKWIS